MVPNHCWYQGHRYDCGVSLRCVFGGKKALDLCNGGMVWSCCVPRAMVRDEDNANAGHIIRSDFTHKRLSFTYFILKASKASRKKLNQIKQSRSKKSIGIRQGCVNTSFKIIIYPKAHHKNRITTVRKDF